MYEDGFKIDHTFYDISCINSKELTDLESKFFELIEMNAYIPRKDYLRISRLMLLYCLHSPESKKYLQILNKIHEYEVDFLL